MLRRVFLLCMLLAYGGICFAQRIPITIPIGGKKPSVYTFPVDSGRFVSVTVETRSISTSQGYTPNFTSVALTLYGPDLQAIGKALCSVSSGSIPVRVAHNREGYALLLHSIDKADIHVVTLNFQGVFVNSRRLPVYYHASAYGDIKLFANPDEKGFYLLRPVKKKLRQLQKVDIYGQVSWQYDLATAPFSTVAEYFHTFDSQTLGFDYSPKDGFARNLVRLRTTDGTLVSNTSFYRPAAKGEKKNLLTNAILIDSTVYAMGMYFEKKIRHHDHDGLFVSATNTKGTPLFTHSYSAGSGLASLLEGKAMVEKTGKLLPSKLIPVDGGLLVSAETVDMIPTGDFATGVASGVALGMIGIPVFLMPQRSAFKVKDMVFFKISSSGQIEKVTRIDKYVSLKQIPVPVTELATYYLRSHAVFDANQVWTDASRSQHRMLLKENPARDQGIPRIACIHIGGNGSTFQLKSRLLTDLIREDRKVKSIDWFMLSTGDVILQYVVKDELHLINVTLDEFK